jgi:hypothetical protein
MVSLNLREVFELRGGDWRRVSTRIALPSLAMICAGAVREPPLVNNSPGSHARAAAWEPP